MQLRSNKISGQAVTLWGGGRREERPQIFSPGSWTAAACGSPERTARAVWLQCSEAGAMEASGVCYCGSCGLEKPHGLQLGAWCSQDSSIVLQGQPALGHGAGPVCALCILIIPQEAWDWSNSLMVLGVR